MNIFYDHQIFTMQTFGGVSRYFCRLAEEIVQRGGNEVRIFAPLHINTALSHVSIAKGHAVRVPRIPGTSRLLRKINQVLTRREIASGWPDIYHATYFDPSVEAAHSAGAKLVVTVYDMVHELFPEAFSRLDQSAEHKAKAVRQADRIICISKQTRDDLLRIHKVDPDRVAVVHLGFELDVSLQANSPVEKQPYLLYVGNRGAYKNFDRLLEVYAQSGSICREYSLLCFGGGSFTRKELGEFRRLGLSNKQVFHRSGNDKSLAAAYLGATAFIYPSKYEGFGFPPLEAMSFDCPVICSNGGSIPEVVGDAAAYFDPGSEQDMGSTISSVLESDSLRERLIGLGRERLKRYSWAKCAAQTLDVYRELI